MSDILSSFRAEVASSGISDKELDRLLFEAREESYLARNPSKNR
jgi:hypothetical protein